MTETTVTMLNKGSDMRKSIRFMRVFALLLLFPLIGCATAERSLRGSPEEDGTYSSDYRGEFASQVRP